MKTKHFYRTWKVGTYRLEIVAEIPDDASNFFADITWTPPRPVDLAPWLEAEFRIKRMAVAESIAEAVGQPILSVENVYS